MLAVQIRKLDLEGKTVVELDPSSPLRQILMRASRYIRTYYSPTEPAGSVRPDGARREDVTDLSFAHPRDLAWEKLEALARKLDLRDLESIILLDRYEGSGVGEGEVKTTIRLTFRSAEKTLEQADVNRERDRLAAALGDELAVRF